MLSDGSHSLELVANLASGGSARTGISVEVANGLESMHRVEVAFAQGQITGDQYAITTTEAVLVPNRLAARYQGPVPADDGDATSELLNVLYGLGSLDPETEEIFDAYWAVASAFELNRLRADAETEVAWAAVITYEGDILGGGGGSGGVLRLTGTGSADWAFEQFYSSTTGGPVEMILWTR